MKKLILVLFILATTTTTILSQTYFSKITTGDIVNDQAYGSGCAWGDYNNDGKLDLIVTSYNDYGPSGFPLLYKNLGNCNFLKILDNPIVTNSLQQTLACAWGDYNHDGKLDLFIATGYNQVDLLYKNIGGGEFVRVTNGEIVNTASHSGGCCWTDYNRDGFLDLLVVCHGNNLLYKGNCDGSFTRITTGPIVTDFGTHRRAAWGDYNNDHYPDLYVTNYNGENDNLYKNNGDGTFTKITSGDIVNSGGWGSGCSWGDYDNDGWLDLYVTNDGCNNFLYHNNQNGTFTKILNDPAVNGVSGSFGCNWGDFDNDGYLDLFVANNYHAYNWLFRNNRNGTFTKILNDPVVTEINSSVGSGWTDINNDGKLDLFVVNQGYGSAPENDCLYKNINAMPWFLIVRLHGGGVGTRLTLIIGNHKLIREVSGGNGCSSQDMLWQHFGLGFLSDDPHTTADSLIIDWNDGYREVATNFPFNQIMDFQGIIGIEKKNENIPKEYSLSQNYPNPFNPSTTIEYSIIKDSHVNITVFDLMGREISTVVNANQRAGNYKINYDGSNLTSGVYFYKIVADNFMDCKKMILVK